MLALDQPIMSWLLAGSEDTCTTVLLVWSEFHSLTLDTFLPMKQSRVECSLNSHAMETEIVKLLDLTMKASGPPAGPLLQITPNKHNHANSSNKESVQGRQGPATLMTSVIHSQTLQFLNLTDSSSTI